LVELGGALGNGAIYIKWLAEYNSSVQNAQLIDFDQNPLKPKQDFLVEPQMQRLFMPKGKCAQTPSNMKWNFAFATARCVHLLSSN
jgi:hypothetical protein